MFYGNKHTTTARIIQTMDDCKFSCQNEYSTLQRMDDCHSSRDKRQMHYLKGWMAAIRVVK